MNGVLGMSLFGKQQLHAVVQVKNRLGLGEILRGLDLNGLQKIGAPAVPIVISGNSQQPLIVFIAMALQEGADIEHGLVNNVGLKHEKGNQHASQTAVTVQKRMQGFELGMQQGQLDQPIRGVGMHILFPVGHGVEQLFAGMGTYLACSIEQP